jgi:S1-C subfamily serine protease
VAPIVAVALGALAACGRGPAAAPPEEVPAAGPRQAVFTIRVTPCETAVGKRAVAVGVDESTVATVAHVFTDARSFTVEEAIGATGAPAGEAATGGQLIWLDIDRDLALVALDEPIEQWLVPGTAEDGAEVAILTVADGRVTEKPGRVLRQVTATLDGAGSRAALELDATITNGDSGAPVIGPGGLLVGMVFATARGDDRGWAIDASEIEAARIASGTAGATVDLGC